MNQNYLILCSTQYIHDLYFVFLFLFFYYWNERILFMKIVLYPLTKTPIHSWFLFCVFLSIWTYILYMIIVLYPPTKMLIDFWWKQSLYFRNFLFNNKRFYQYYVNKNQAQLTEIHTCSNKQKNRKQLFGSEGSYFILFFFLAKTAMMSWLNGE